MKVTARTVNKIQRDIVKVQKEMKRMAKLYTEHKEQKDYEAADMIKEELKVLTKNKKELDISLENAAGNLYAKDELQGDINNK